MANPNFTQSQLKERLHYDPETGLFTWIKVLSNYVKTGSVAGTDSGHGYIKIGILGGSCYAHRLAWFYVHGVWPHEIDHTNRIRSDNRLSNLRSCTRSQNACNSHTNKRTVHDLPKGVHAARDKFKAVINCNCKEIHLGTFDTVEEANKARLAAVDRYHVEFAEH